MPDTKNLEDSSYDDRSVVAIVVGHGGMGKTTLAQGKIQSLDLGLGVQQVQRGREVCHKNATAHRRNEMSFSCIQQALEELGEVQEVSFGARRRVQRRDGHRAAEKGDVKSKRYLSVR